MAFVDPWLLGLLSAAFAAGGAWAGVRLALAQLKRDATALRHDVNRAHARLDDHDAVLHRIRSRGL